MLSLCDIWNVCRSAVFSHTCDEMPPSWTFVSWALLASSRAASPSAPFAEQTQDRVLTFIFHVPLVFDLWCALLALFSSCCIVHTPPFPPPKKKKSVHDNWVRCVLVHPSGEFVLSASDDRSVRAFDVKVKALLFLFFRPFALPFVSLYTSPSEMQKDQENIKPAKGSLCALACLVW